MFWPRYNSLRQNPDNKKFLSSFGALGFHGERTRQIPDDVRRALHIDPNQPVNAKVMLILDGSDARLDMSFPRNERGIPIPSCHHDMSSEHLGIPLGLVNDPYSSDALVTPLLDLGR